MFLVNQSALCLLLLIKHTYIPTTCQVNPPYHHTTLSTSIKGKKTIKKTSTLSQIYINSTHKTPTQFCRHFELSPNKCICILLPTRNSNSGRAPRLNRPASTHQSTYNQQEKKYKKMFVMSAQSHSSESEEVPKRTMLIKMFFAAKDLRFGKTLT